MIGSKLDDQCCKQEGLKSWRVLGFEFKDLKENIEYPPAKALFC